jgi:3-isopropylmalate dehydrogenase
MANPIAMIGSLAMALRYSFEMGELADRIESAISHVLEKGLRTADIAGGAKQILSTSQMGAAVLAELKSAHS